MSGEETVRRLREEREARRVALRDNIREAQGAMASAGFAISDQATPLDMVKKLLARNADQKKLEDGLRERLKAAESMAPVYEADVTHGHPCPFWILQGHCEAREDYCRCAHEPRSTRFPNDYPGRPPCRLDEGPILVKKAEADSGGGRDAKGETTTARAPGGDRSNDPESPR